MLIHLALYLPRDCPVVFLVKKCSACKVNKLVYMFYTSANSIGLQSRCKECHKICGNIDYLKNRKRILKRQAIYHKIHKKERNAKTREWNQNDYKLHPEKSRNRKQKRRARIKGNGFIEYIDLEVLAKRDNWVCHICKKRVTRKNWSHDHLVTVADKGETSYLNVALAHTWCNITRGNGRIPAQLRLLP